ncbi:unnamed protein product [Amoebophrya sp. A25]|nr:unnamed protein product [Amoebophrya sp. A25]|eukprot:GSA25T00016173001.1
MATRSRTWCVVNTDAGDADFLYHDEKAIYYSAEAASHRTGEKYEFDHVSGPGLDQDDRFGEIAPLLEAAVKEKKSAFFLAFGPKSSGKTYGITGGSRKWKQRGLIPRTLSWIFQNDAGGDLELERKKVTVSFFEVYKGGIVDLMASRHAAKEPLGIECEGRNVMIDLAEKEVRDESEAYHRLFYGDANRHFAPGTETSRGHCVFLINLEDRENARIDEDTRRPERLTLSFVDIAAGEEDESAITSSASGEEQAVSPTTGQAIGAIRENWVELRRMLETMSKGEAAKTNDPLCLVLQSLFEDTSMHTGCSMCILRENTHVTKWLEFAATLRKAMRMLARKQRRVRRTVNNVKKKESAEFEGAEMVDADTAIAGSATSESLPLLQPTVSLLSSGSGSTSTSSGPRTALNFNYLGVAAGSAREAGDATTTTSAKSSGSGFAGAFVGSNSGGILSQPTLVSVSSASALPTASAARSMNINAKSRGGGNAAIGSSGAPFGVKTISLSASSSSILDGANNSGKELNPRLHAATRGLKLLNPRGTIPAGAGALGSKGNKIGPRYVTGSTSTLVKVGSAYPTTALRAGTQKSVGGVMKSLSSSAGTSNTAGLQQHAQQVFNGSRKNSRELVIHPSATGENLQRGLGRVSPVSSTTSAKHDAAEGSAAEKRADSLSIEELAGAPEENIPTCERTYSEITQIPLYMADEQKAADVAASGLSPRAVTGEATPSEAPAKEGAINSTATAVTEIPGYALKSPRSVAQTDGMNYAPSASVASTATAPPDSRGRVSQTIVRNAAVVSGGGGPSRTVGVPFVIRPPKNAGASADEERGDQASPSSKKIPRGRASISSTRVMGSFTPLPNHRTANAQASFSVHPGTRRMLHEQPGFWTPMIRPRTGIENPQPALTPIEDLGLGGNGPVAAALQRSRSTRPRGGVQSVMAPPPFMAFRRGASVQPRRAMNAGLQTVPVRAPAFFSLSNKVSIPVSRTAAEATSSGATGDAGSTQQSEHVTNISGSADGAPTTAESQAATSGTKNSGSTPTGRTRAASVTRGATAILPISPTPAAAVTGQSVSRRTGAGGTITTRSGFTGPTSTTYSRLPVCSTASVSVPPLTRMSLGNAAPAPPVHMFAFGAPKRTLGTGATAAGAMPANRVVPPQTATGTSTSNGLMTQPSATASARGGAALAASSTQRQQAVSPIEQLSANLLTNRHLTPSQKAAQSMTSSTASSSARWHATSTTGAGGASNVSAHVQTAVSPLNDQASLSGSSSTLLGGARTTLSPALVRALTPSTRGAAGQARVGVVSGIVSHQQQAPPQLVASRVGITPSPVAEESESLLSPAQIKSSYKMPNTTSTGPGITSVSNNRTYSTRMKLAAATSGTATVTGLVAGPRAQLVAGGTLPRPVPAPFTNFKPASRIGAHFGSRNH